MTYLVASSAKADMATLQAIVLVDTWVGTCQVIFSLLITITL